jgi:glycosyltransferase involved in cell wall biosynthesis
MTAAIYSAELTAGNAHLMPWHTVLEVAAQWQAAGERTLVVSGGAASGEETLGGVRVAHAARPRRQSEAERLAGLLAGAGVARLYFPVAPGSLWPALVRALERSRIELVWYFPGAWYTAGQVARAARDMRWRALAPYAAQALIPKRVWAARLLALGRRPVIAMTRVTASRLRAAGYPADLVREVPPGRAPVARSGEPTAVARDIARAVARLPYFLFFGPPNPIRGVLRLLDAFARLGRTHPACRLVCLFRSDGNVDERTVRAELERRAFGERLVAHWRSVPPPDLDHLLKGCFAVLKPFLVVPSEIPLAVVETAACGKPVIGFEGDGTGEFIGRFGLLAKHGSSKELADAMRRLLDDPALYESRCRAARAVYESHPDWAQVAERWTLAAAAAGNAQAP